MPSTFKHVKTLTVADSADTSIARPSDWNAEHRFGLLLTNRSGAARAAGDVMVVDSASNEGAVLTNTRGDRRPVVIVQEAILASVQGLFAHSGIMTVAVQGAVTRGNGLRTSETAGKAEDAGAIIIGGGTFALALTAAAGPGAGTVQALLLGSAAGTGVIDRQLSTIDVANTTVDSDLYRFAVPGGLLGTDRALRLTLLGDVLNNSGSAANVVVRMKYGATNVYSTTLAPPHFGNARQAFRVDALVQAKDAANAQIGWGVTHLAEASVGLTGESQQVTPRWSEHTAMSEDSTTAKDIAVTADWASALTTLSVRRLTATLELL